MLGPDWLTIIHPLLAIAVVYPLIGIVGYFAWQTRQRRLQLAVGKSKIAPTVGGSHVQVGFWLSAWVVAVGLLGLAHPIIKTIVAKQRWQEDPLLVLGIALIFGGTIGAFVLLHRARSIAWRLGFAALTGAGIVVLGLQDGIYRRTNEWFLSHYYYGLVAMILMVIALAILPEIYRDLRLRRLHIALSSIALLLFLGQAVTGTRDLLEIPLSWQGPAISRCDFGQRRCP
jgi:hypothetical protein